MTDRAGTGRTELVVHKPARECAIVEPHPGAMCGIVQARRRIQTAADTAAADDRAGSSTAP